MRLKTATTFPSCDDAPLTLRAMDGNCGLLAAWATLRYFHKRVDSRILVQRCAHTPRYGVFTIGIACALAEAGLQVEFHTAYDAGIKPLERRLYRRAKGLGIPIRPPIAISELRNMYGRGRVPIVYYDTKNGQGHFSPLLGMKGRCLYLPHDDVGGMPLDAFDNVWRAAGICRQAIVAGIASTRLVNST